MTVWVRYNEHWVAGFAPVGNTRFFVVVATLLGQNCNRLPPVKFLLYIVSVLRE